jgi:hypothetical protein
MAATLQQLVSQFKYQNDDLNLHGSRSKNPPVIAPVPSFKSAFSGNYQSV